LNENRPFDLSADGSGDELDLAAMAASLWAHKWLAVALVGVCLGLAVLYLNLVPYKYTAQLALTPAEHSGSKVPGGLASLGSIVGVDIGGEAGSSFALFGEAVKSTTVMERLSKDERIMQTVFSAQWDPSINQFREPLSPVRGITRPIKALLAVPERPWQPPGATDLRDYAKLRIIVTEDRKKAITTLSFEHRDPEFAKYFLARASTEADTFLREKSLARSTDYVRYLERRLSEVQVAEYRQSLAQALSNYENLRMMASSTAAYAAEPFGVVTVTSRPTSPQPLTVLAAAGLAGVALWAFYVLIARGMLIAFRDRRRLAKAGAAAE
jgi:hypothetical protein